MGRPPCQHEPSLARFRIDLVHFDEDLVLGLRDASTQVLVEEGGSQVPKTTDSPSVLYATGSAVGPYRLV